MAWNQSKAIAFDHHGVVAEHDLVYKPSEHAVERVFYADGQFLVELDPEQGWKHVAYWSATPKQRFELAASFHTWGGAVPTLHVLGDGAVTFGSGRPFRAGDSHLSGSADLASDGTRFWCGDWRGCRSYDPSKGQAGAPGKPAFFDWERAGWKVDFDTSTLGVVPADLAMSPLGIHDHLSGLRIRALADANDSHHEVERIDGVRWAGALCPHALVTLPGDAAPRPATTAQASSKRFRGGAGPGAVLYTAAADPLATINEHDWAARGWAAVPVPPLAFWHYLAPRDEAGSAALRAITLDAARAIVAAARSEVAAGGDVSGRALPATTAVIRELLPAVRDAALVRGIAGLAERAAELAIRCDAIAAERAKEHASVGGEGLLAEGMLVRKLATALASGRQTKLADFDLELGEWLRRPRARAIAALSPIAEPELRARARDLVRALAGTLFADDLSKLRWMTIEEPDDYSDDDDWNTLVVKKIDGSTFAIHATDNWALELSHDGKFRAPAPYAIGKAEQLVRGIGTGWANAYLALADAPVPWDPQIAVALAARTELSVAEATLLYLGGQGRGDYSKDFLGKHKREVVGLKLGEADAARTTFKSIDDDAFGALIERAAPDDPALLATPLAPGGFVERLGDAWRAKYGKRAKIAQDLVAQVKKELVVDDELADYLSAFAGADDAWFCKPDLRPLPELGGWRSRDGLTPSVAKELFTLTSWLFHARAVGDPVRAGIPSVVAALRALVLDPRVVWKFDELYVGDDAKGAKQADDLFALVGGREVELPKHGDDACAQARDDGAIVIARYGNMIVGGFRPAKYDGAAKQKIDLFARALWDPDSGEMSGSLECDAARLLRGDGFAAFADRVRDTPVAPGGYECDPRASAAKLVAKVAKAHGLSADAAALYLQVLALPEPTERAVQTWNGWAAKQYKAVAAELVKKKLVVEGKRERAGRSIFIKGGYTKGAGKDLPIEEWKLPFHVGLDRHVPSEPAHLAFARAWKRVDDGDVPA